MIHATRSQFPTHAKGECPARQCLAETLFTESRLPDQIISAIPSLAPIFLISIERLPMRTCLRLPPLVRTRHFVAEAHLPIQMPMLVQS